MTKFKAFTLAEVLITLGIIGVVAALSIPVITQNVQNHTYVGKIKKVYTQLSQAAVQTMGREGITDLAISEYSDEEDVKKFFTDNFKIIKECEDGPTPCFAAKYRTISNDTQDSSEWFYPDSYIFVTADGTAIGVMWGYFGQERDDGDFEDHGFISLQIDINGSKGPNVAGKDLFHLEVYSDGKVAEGYTSGEYYAKNKEDAKIGCQEGWGYAGVRCFTYLQNNNWTIDY